MLGDDEIAGVIGAIRAEHDIQAQQPEVREIPTWPRTGMTAWVFVAGREIDAPDGKFTTAAAWRAQELTQIDGEIFVAQLEIAESDIEVNRANLLTFISSIVHEAHMALVDGVEAHKQRQQQADGTD